MKALKTLTTWTLAASLLAAAAAWLIWTAGCLYSPTGPLCRHDYGGVIVALAGVGMVVIPLAYAARRRALRVVVRGRYARPVGGGRPRAGGVVESLMHLAVEGEWPQAQVAELRHPLLDVPAGWGWVVPLEDGSGVIVLWDDFRQWLYDCWELQQNPKFGRRGATSQRYWDGRIGRPQTLARNHLLEKAGGLRRNKTAWNSTRRIVGTPWGILERLAAVWPPVEIF